MLKDDRGRGFPLCPRSALERRAPGEVALRLELARQNSPRGLVLWVMPPVAAAAVFVMAAIVFPGRFGPLRSFLFLLPVIALATLVLLVAWILIWITAGRKDARRAAALMRDARLCPSCAYPLKDLSPDPDGATTCPECSAAWRLAGREEAQTP